MPHIRRAGDLPTAIALYAPRPLLLCGLAEGSDVAAIRGVYRAAGEPKAFASRRTVPGAKALARWILAK